MKPFANRQWEMAPTPEQQYEIDFQWFQFDACMTVILAIASIAEDVANEVAYLILGSKDSESRAKHGILTDYTKFRDTASAANRIIKELCRYNTPLSKMLQRISKVSKDNQRDYDSGEDLITRMDVAAEMFRPDYENLRRVLYAKLKPLKCTDPQALYPLLYALLMAKRYTAMSRYIAGFCAGFKKGQPFSHLCHLQLQQPLYDLIHRCRFYDKQGNELLLLLDPDERKQYQADSQTRKWQLKHKGESLRPVDIDEYLYGEDIMRASWQMEKRMMELKTIDEIILRAEGQDPEYRHDYKIKRIQGCTELYEQARLNIAIHLSRHQELPERIAAYLAALPQYHASVRSVRTPKPVVAITITAARDEHGKVIYMDQSKSQAKPYFNVYGVWNSAGEASREMRTPWIDIQKSIRSRNPDARGIVWMTFDKYLVILYKSQQEFHPDIAARILAAVPTLPALLEADARQLRKNAPVPDASASGSTLPKTA